MHRSDAEVTDRRASRFALQQIDHPENTKQQYVSNDDLEVTLMQEKQDDRGEREAG